MKVKSKKHKRSKTLRIFRKVHRFTGVLLAIFFLVMAITGILLGLKKHSGDMLLPGTRTGTTSDLSQWMPLESLHGIALQVLQDSLSPSLSHELDRIDIRKDKGTVKFIFSRHYHGIQLDGATGRVLHIGKRNSDLIENLHDGSILDRYFGTSNGQIKLIYSLVMGFALVVFIFTGVWLWYSPKRKKFLIRTRE